MSNNNFAINKNRIVSKTQTIRFTDYIILFILLEIFCLIVLQIFFKCPPSRLLQQLEYLQTILWFQSVFLEDF